MMPGAIERDRQQAGAHDEREVGEVDSDPVGVIGEIHLVENAAGLGVRDFSHEQRDSGECVAGRVFEVGENVVRAEIDGVTCFIAKIKGVASRQLATRSTDVLVGMAFAARFADESSNALHRFPWRICVKGVRVESTYEECGSEYENECSTAIEYIDLAVLPPFLKIDECHKAENSKRRNRCGIS